jgi:hypothetical protein
MVGFFLVASFVGISIGHFFGREERRPQRQLD